ncbi:MAG: hypothetical protein K2N94_00735 [Lachnospiraceae bacterium]|nr:hypothetical protein [Lachnospiraceae bacterium]
MKLKYIGDGKHSLRGRRLYKKWQSRREAMDRITLGECLHLYCVLGWTADIRGGHLLALGRMPDDEDHEAKPLFRAWKDPAERKPLPGGCTAREARSGKSTPVLYRNACEIATKNQITSI